MLGFGASVVAAHNVQWSGSKDILYSTLTIPYPLPIITPLCDDQAWNRRLNSGYRGQPSRSHRKCNFCLNNFDSRRRVSRLNIDKQWLPSKPRQVDRRLTGISINSTNRICTVLGWLTAGHLLEAMGRMSYSNISIQPVDIPTFI